MPQLRMMPWVPFPTPVMKKAPLVVSVEWNMGLKPNKNECLHKYQRTLLLYYFAEHKVRPGLATSSERAAQLSRVKGERKCLAK